MRTHWRSQFLALVVVVLAATVLGQRVSRADYVGNKYTDAATGQVLEYNVYVPAGYDPAKKYPLMVFLHAANNTNPPNRTLSSDGVGWTGTFINTPHQMTDPSFFMIPISQTNMSGWGEATQPISTPEKFEGALTIKVLQSDVMTKYSIDPTRLYITGPSMGGRGTWDIIRRYPGLFAAAAPAAAPASPDDAALFKNQNIWAICGEVDPIVQGERDAITAIRAAGGNPIYTELAGHGHDSWRWVYPDPQFVPWIYAQRLGVPWWTVTKPPVGPITGSTPTATLTPNQPVTMPPPNLPNSFGGSPGAAGGSPGTAGTSGGMTASGGTNGAGGKPSGGGTSGGAGAQGSGGARGTGGDTGAGGVTASGTGGSSVVPGTGGASTVPASSGGSAGPIATGGTTVSGSGGATSGGTATGGTTTGPSGSTGGASGAQDSGGSSGGCSVASGRGRSFSLASVLALLGLVALRRRKTGRR